MSESFADSRAALAIRLHLVGAASDPRSVCLRTGTGTTWSQARAAIRACGIPVAERMYVGDRLVPDDHPIGHPPLLNAAQLSESPTAPEQPHLLELVVTEGPQVGARVTLDGSVQRIGRAPSNTLVLDDPDLSRTHLITGVDQGRAMVSDTGSTNGSHIDSRPLSPRSPVELRAGQRLRAGSTTFSLERTMRADDAPPLVDESCRVPFQRKPRNPLRLNEIALTRPSPPGPPERRKLPWPVIALPLVLSLGLVLVMHNTMFLMFALLGPAMMLGQHLADRQGAAGRAKEQAAEHVAALGKLAEDRKAAIAAELAIRRQAAPPISDVLRVASMRDARLWARSPEHADYLTCRIGTGTIPSLIRVTGGDRPTEVADLPNAPIALALNDSRVIGMTGRRDHRRALLDGMLLQLATWQSPRFLRIVVCCGSVAARDRWAWATDLPHLTGMPHSASTIVDLESDEKHCQRVLSELLPVQDDDLGTPRDRRPVATVLVLDECARLGSRSEVIALLQNVDRAGIAVVALGDAPDLPAECEICIDVASSTTITVTGSLSASGRPDLPEHTLAATVASQLAQVCDVTPDTDAGTLPDHATLPDVWRTDGCDVTDPDEIAARWRTAPRSTVFPLGYGAEGVLHLDLATDGPHTLIAGTTGAGKSELLQSLVTSLAFANRPDEMVFVLVDYKGGAAFQHCAQLPHTVGLVTDLDAHLTARALTSLNAEVRRREQLLGSVGAKDLEDYQRVSGAAPMPRLMLVIDEFRVLAEEMPDFISGLVRIAAVGRSLGIHLVLATQRPAGVVSADIRANVNLRIALRVRDTSDSQDVIESGAAAAIPAELPGRAIVRTGGGRAVAFQTARIGGRTGPDQEAVEVGVIEMVGAAPTPLTPAAEAEGPTDLQRAAAAIETAARRLGISVPRSPWPPPLPSAVSLSELTGDPHRIGGGAAGIDALRFGLMDLPEAQATRPVGWDLDRDGQLAIVGGPRSGRTTLLRTLAIQAARAWPRDGVAIYAVDASSGLRALDALPQCGAVIGTHDIARLDRLVSWLINEIHSRQTRFADDLVSGFVEHSNSRGTLPRIVLLVDGWEALTEVDEEATLGRLTDDVLQILRDGPSAGVYAAVTGGRALATGRVASSFSSRLVLRLGDPGDVVLLGMRESDLPRAMPAGRAVTCLGALELQVATPTADHSGTVVAQHISQLASTLTASGIREFAPMPERCRLTELPRLRDRVVVGIGGPEITPIGLPLGGFGELSALVAGPARSGRTTALLAIANQLSDRAVCWVPGHGHPPDLPATIEVVDPMRPETLAHWLNAHPGGAVLADDLDELLASPIDELLTDYLQHGRRAGGIVCASGQSETLSNAFRGVVAELRRKQTGLILQPGRRDGDLLGAQLGPMGRAHPGSGALVIRSRAVPIQVAT